MLKTEVIVKIIFSEVWAFTRKMADHAKISTLKIFLFFSFPGSALTSSSAWSRSDVNRPCFVSHDAINSTLLQPNTKQPLSQSLSSLYGQDSPSRNSSYAFMTSNKPPNCQWLNTRRTRIFHYEALVTCKTNSS